MRLAFNAHHLIHMISLRYQMDATEIAAEVLLP